MPNDSRNLMRVLAGEDASDDNSPAAAYMDVAVAVQRGEGRYIVYVQDNGANVSALNSELITLIVEALIFGLIISVLLSFLLSKTLITPIERLTEGAPETRSACSPAPSMTWPSSSSAPWKKWRTSAPSWAPSFCI